MKKYIFPLLPILFSAIFLVISIRGLLGVPNEVEVNENSWKQDGPFELSPERGRFALTYSLIENKSFFFSVPLARFVAPDLGYDRGNYVSLFAPGVSLLIAPGYLLGKALGATQIGAVVVIGIFALLNLLLIRAISRFLGAKPSAATLAGFVFLFATPAYTYAVTLYQHHISTFVILLSIYLLFKYDKWLSVFLVWFLLAFSLVLDYPNFFMMFPIGVFALTKFVNIKAIGEKIKIRFKLSYLLTFFGAMLPVLILLSFNYFSFGNPLQLSGTVSSVIAIDNEGFPTLPERLENDDPDIIHKLLNPEEQKKNLINFFNPRDLVQGFYVHLLSPDRGIIIYAPLVLLGTMGAYLLYKKQNPNLVLLSSVLLTNVVLYSMWGDPWGGWAFGSRYLIPTYAIMCIFLGVYISNFPRLRLARWIFRVILIYSLAVNALGAITTSANPPKGEAKALEPISGRQERYSFSRNWEYLRDTGSKSFIYREYVSDKASARVYYLALLSGLVGVSLVLSKALYREK